MWKPGKYLRFGGSIVFKLTENVKITHFGTTVWIYRGK